jgi:hypothetical protein
MGSMPRSYKEARWLGPWNQNDCGGEGQQQFGSWLVCWSVSQSESAAESEVSASQWWPEVARSQWPGVATLRNYETVSSQ